MGLFLFRVFLSALINIILVLALGTTEQIALSACGKDLLTMLAQLQRVIFIRQHIEKELLQAKHRLEEAQARDRAKERKARTRRLIQEGAIL